MTQGVEDVEHDLADEYRRYHALIQAPRFAGTFAAALGAQLLAGAPTLGPADWRSLTAAAAWTAFRQWRKTAPQAIALGMLHDARQPDRGASNT